MWLPVVGFFELSTYRGLAVSPPADCVDYCLGFSVNKRASAARIAFGHHIHAYSSKRRACMNNAIKRLVIALDGYIPKYIVCQCINTVDCEVVLSRPVHKVIDRLILVVSCLQELTRCDSGTSFN